MSLTGSAVGTILKIGLPAFAKTLLDHLGIGNKLTNKLLEQTIDVAVDALPEGDRHQALEQQTQKLAARLRSEMQPLFEQEARLEQGSQEAIFLAVAETLLQGGVSLDGLMNVGLDAERLKNQLLQARPGLIVGFSENEKSLYRQAITFASASLIETVPQLEGFQLSVTQAMLRQTEELVSFVRSQKELALQQRDQFLTRYRQVIETELDKPDKFGVPLLKNLLSQQRLCEAYVQLSIAETVEESEDELQLRQRRGAFPNHQNLEKRSKNVEEVLSTRRRLIIRGGAGAGKTSLMHWLAVHTARQDFEAPLQHWNSLVPFFIRLRSRVDHGFPAVQDFVQPIAKNIADEMPVGWVRQQLDRGCALVLIDGVDELPRVKRQSFFESLQKLVTEFPEAIYVTTSRPAGLKDENGEEWVEWEQWVKAEQFSNCVMEPMTLPEIEQFVSRWHRALPATNRQEDKDPQKIADNLMRQLRQRSQIRQLAETPLLCTMICALHYVNEGTLPGTRIRLYDKCIEMLLEERDKQREIKTDIHLTLRQKEEFLRKFAYWLMQNNYSDAEVEQADLQFQDCLRYYRLPDVDGRVIRQFLLERSGLLREPLMGRIDFVHRTFQEYLAAKAALHDDAIGVLLGRADDDQWREAIIIAVGEGSRKQQMKLLNALLQRGDKSAKKRHYLHLLAVACLETDVQIDSDLRAEIETRAKALLPPKDEDEIALVARAGDEIVPLLAYNPSFPINEACNCIKVLAQIGSRAAMQTLTDYAQAAYQIEDEYEQFGYAFGRGWYTFDVDLYTREVLFYVKTLSLSGTSVEDISPLRELSQLQSLSLSGTSVEDISPLRGLSQLQSLSLSGASVEDISPLRELSQLQSLYLDETSVKDISPLRGLSQLQSLSLSGASVEDISPLRELSQLQSLSLSGTSVEGISPLRGLSQLQSLSLDGTSVKDISSLKELSQLQILTLSGTSVEDITPLRELSQLQSLSLDGTSVKDISSLKELSQLQILTLSGTSVEDISPLRGLSQLQSLSLNGTSVKDISLLKELSQLQTLYLNGTSVEDISLLKELSQLQSLYLFGTSIQDFSPLTTLTQLEALYLSGTQVHDVDLSPKLKKILRIID